ncbi:MAG TPA: F0F1 ATP synthase subunit epsilon [Syntrophales bacterium]|jgi:F-type H+-transporting ATPase subunit epsilon|nr:F0F1 ATP synthase subunit epsilon [Syntrophales bacterium]
MADELMVEIVTPERMVFNGKVEEITVPGSEGEFGVLKGHAALLSGVDIGALSLTQEGKKRNFAVADGYVEVTATKVTVLVESAERSDMIDKERAQRAKHLAEEKMAKLPKEDPEYDKAKASLDKALIRLSVAEKN